jgi:hypothetical protein
MDHSVSEITSRADREVFRPAHDGLFYETHLADGGSQIEFQSFSGGRPLTVYTTKHVTKGFSLLPDQKALLVGVQAFGANLELWR